MTLHTYDDDDLILPVYFYLFLLLLVPPRLGFRIFYTRSHFCNLIIFYFIFSCMCRRGGGKWEVEC